MSIFGTALLAATIVCTPQQALDKTMDVWNFSSGHLQPNVTRELYSEAKVMVDSLEDGNWKSDLEQALYAADLYLQGKEAFDEKISEVWDAELGELTEGANREKLNEAIEALDGLPECGLRDDLKEITDAVDELLADKEALKSVVELTKSTPSNSGGTYYGKARITFYCNCSACCGQWAGGGTASGTTPTANRTVACGDLPFGTRILVDGQEYIVEDRGVGSQCIDVFVDTHEEAVNRGLYYTDVYILSQD